MDSTVLHTEFLGIGVFVDAPENIAETKACMLFWNSEARGIEPSLDPLGGRPCFHLSFLRKGASAADFQSLLWEVPAVRTRSVPSASLPPQQFSPSVCLQRSRITFSPLR